MKKILLIKGDGIGGEVVTQTKKIIDFFDKNSDKNGAAHVTHFSPTSTSYIFRTRNLT
jgi:isocitrate/isopropylmalate dehydrogenase